jgi:hypothetical protein
MAKKIILFFVFILVALGTFLAGYLFSRRTNVAEPNQQALVGNSLIDRFQAQPEKRAEPVGPFVLSENTADSQAISSDGKKILYYNSETGEVRSSSIYSTDNSTLISKIQSGAAQINWASNQTLIATYKNGSIYYDLGSGFSKKLDSQTENPSLSKSGDKVAYIYFDTNLGSGEIRVSDPRADGYKKIISTLFNGYQLHWINDSLLSLFRPPTQEDPTYWLFTLDTETGNLRRILNLKKDLWIKWSPNGQKLLYAYTDPTTLERNLYLMNLSDLQEIKLTDAADISDCTWSIDNKTLYCADKDSFVTIDASSQNPSAIKLLTKFQGDISSFSNGAVGLLLSSAEDYLIFKTPSDGKLYSLPLSQ